MIVRIISTDVSGQRDYADIILPQPSVQENSSPNDQVERNMKNILNPQNNPQNIMDNIDYIVTNARKLTQDQVVYFRNMMGSVVASNT